jgi:hypothetical protein
MAEDPNAQPATPPGDDQQGPLTQMIIQTDQALTSISQILSKASPEAARAMAQVNEQYRQIIQSVLNQQQGASGGAQQPPQMVSPETQGKAAMMAY